MTNVEYEQMNNYKMLQYAFAIGGPDESDRWNKPEKVKKEFILHVIRVGYLFQRSMGVDETQNEFAKAHSREAPDKHRKDQQLTGTDLEAKLESEQGDLLLLTKQHVCPAVPRDAEEELTLANRMGGCHKGFKDTK